MTRATPDDTRQCDRWGPYMGTQVTLFTDTRTQPNWKLRWPQIRANHRLW